MAAKTFTGARAIIKIDNVACAIAENYSYTVNTPQEPVYVLGKMDAVELVSTSYEAIPISLSGVRVIGVGPHTAGGGKVLKLQDLIASGEVTITIDDRQDTSKPMVKFLGCKSTGYSTGVGAKGTQRVNINYLGRIAMDEDGDQSETNTANSGF
jgi:hypothetical protein